MRRYAGEELPPGCRIAVVANDALGNYIVSTPLLKLLRNNHKPSLLHYFSGTRTEEFWRQDKKLDWGYPLHGSDPHMAVLSTFVENGKQQYDLVINIENSPWAKCFTATIAGLKTYVCGPCLGADGRKDLPFDHDERGKLWADREWIAEDITKKYPFLRTGFIGEIFCRLAYLDGDVPPYDVPSEPVFGPVPDVIISMTASLPEKIWPFANWRAVLQMMKSSGLSVGLVGAKPTAQAAFWQGACDEDNIVRAGLAMDLRGKYRLPEVVGVLKRARLVLSIDSGIVHLAVAAGARTIGLYRHGIHRLWAPPSDRLTVVTPGEGKAVDQIEVERVCREVEAAL